MSVLREQPPRIHRESTKGMDELEEAKEGPGRQRKEPRSSHVEEAGTSKGMLLPLTQDARGTVSCQN